MIDEKGADDGIQTRRDIQGSSRLAAAQSGSEEEKKSCASTINDTTRERERDTSQNQGAQTSRSFISNFNLTCKT
jgi:hypothetical protein